MTETLWLDLLGTEVRYYDAGGVRTRCIEAGDGPPVVLLHGIGGHAEAFARNVVPLAHHHRVLAVDYLGFGLTDKPSEPANRDAYVTHLLDLLDAADIERAHLVGESLGGWIAMWTAILHPERVHRLVSVCGARLEVDTDEVSERYTREGIAELRRLTREFVEQPSREAVRRRMEWLFRSPQESLTDELVELRWRLYQRDQADRVLKDAADPTRRGPTNSHGLGLDELARIGAPTLFLWTTHNPTTTAATAERAAEHVPDCSFELLEECGHWPQWEDPEAFNRAVLDFLAD